jgi:hypothetical protein
MKQKDIALVAVIVIISGVISLVLSNMIIGSPKSKPQEVEVVEAISADFATPDKKYFNQNSKNFTQTITIGDNPNPQPFNE